MAFATYFNLIIFHLFTPLSYKIAIHLVLVKEREITFASFPAGSSDALLPRQLLIFEVNLTISGQAPALSMNHILLSS